ncbi:Ig-like domain-containing protein [Bacterioplanoides sp.]|uniref:Ig-like domain-containing protein n=1 Tax=Bacterioplanoides sp. TaxID=2066072 RepID=UPI003B592FDA
MDASNWEYDNATPFAPSGTAFSVISPNDADGSLTAAAGVTEPVGLDTTIDTLGEAVNVFDFTLSDGGGGDGQPMAISQVVLNVTGTATDAERGKITWRLNGPDVSNVSGSYSAGSDSITFSGLSISIADGASEVYTINAFYNDNTGITEDRTFILNIDGDTDLTVGAGGTQMGTTSPVSNGSGGTYDVVATSLVFSTQPSGSVSGAALTTQPIVTAQDAFGNTDSDFTETITLTEASAGTLSNTSAASSGGVATFSGLAYTATADQQSFTLTANDQDGIGSDLATINANAVTSDVVATKLVFSTQPAPTSIGSGQSIAFTQVPVVRALDVNNTLDTGFTGSVTLSIVDSGGTSLTGGHFVNSFSSTSDPDGGGQTTVIQAATSGEVTFSGLALQYTVSGASDVIDIRAAASGLTAVNSTSITAATNAVPVVDLNGGGAGNDSSVSFDEITGAVSIAGSAAVTDTDGDTINSITVTLTNDQDGAAEGLSVSGAAQNALAGISGASDISLSDTISITGATATVAEVSTFLQSITYDNSSDTPNTTNRNVTVVVNDGSGNSISRSATISVSAITSATTQANGFNTTTGSNLSPSLIFDSSSETLTIGSVSHTSGTANGAGGADTLVTLDGANLTAINISNFETLNIPASSSVEMSSTQHGLFSSFTDNASQSIIISSGSDNLTGRSVIESYNLNDTYSGVFTLGAATQNVTGDDANNQIINVGALTPTGTISGGLAGTDVISATDGANISGATLVGMETLSVANSGDTVTLTLTQLSEFTNLEAPGGGVRTLAFSDSGNLTDRSYPDFAISTAAGGSQTIESTAATVNGLTLIAADSGSDSFLIVGSDGAQTINGSAGSDTLEGGKGDDIIRPGAGTDTLSGGAGADRFSGSISELNGNTITDLSDDDFIIVEGNTAVVGHGSGQFVNGSILRIDTDGSYGNGYEITINVSNLENMQIADMVEQGADTRISFQATIPTITSATYDGATGNLVVTGVNFFSISGANNDVDVSLLSITGQGGATRTLTTSADVELTSTTQFTVVVSGADKIALDSLINSNGTSSSDSTSYNLAAADNFIVSSRGGDSTDATGNTITASNSDRTSPAIQSVNLVGTPAKNAATVTYQVTFNESVNNVSTDDFVLDLSGNVPAPTASIASVSSASGTSVNVVVNSIAGTGNLRLDVRANTNITDDAGNGNGTNGSLAAYTSGEVHSLDREAPAVSAAPALDAASDSGVSSSDRITNDNTPTFSGSAEAGSVVTLSSSIDGVVGSAIANAVNGSWSVTTNTLSDGNHNITTTVRDNAGNTSAASAATAVQIDTARPVVQSFSRTNPVAEETSFNFVVWLVQFNEAVTAVDSADFSVTGTTAGLDIILISDLSRFEVRARGGDLTDLNGVVGLNFNNPNISDIAGNIIAGSEPGVDQTFTLKNAFPPVISEGSSVAVNMDEDGSPTAFSLTLNARDANNDTLTWSIQNQATKGAASVSGTGTSKVINYLPTADQNGSDNFVVRVSDGALTDDITVNVTIAAVNDAPVISGTPATSVNEDVAYSFTPTTNDVDNDSLTFSVTNKPAWAEFNTTTGVLSGTPGNDDSGVTNGIVISVTDGTATADLAAFNLTVNAVNDAPTISGTPATTVNEDQAYSFTPTAADAEGSDLTFSITNKPVWADFDSETGALTGTPDNDNIGTTSGIVISVSDGSLSTSLPAFNLEVVNQNDAATISLSGAAAVGQQLTAVITDADGLPDSGINYQWSAGGVNIQSATAANYTPLAADIGKTLMVSASFTDARGSAESVTSAATAAVISAADYRQQQALAAISKTANKAAEPAPSVQNYQDAGVKHADAETLQRILPILNRAVAQQATVDDVNELSEIQALLDVVLLGQDIDADGLPGIVEGGADKDSDNDGTADMRDSDADNDGIADVLELSLDKTDSDNDGIIDWFDADTDNNGTLNNSETLDANYDGVNDARDSLAEIIAANNALDVDSDGLINSLDLDADNDGVFDVIEAGLTDKDENALLDQGANVITDADLLTDTNVDGTANFLQLKSDGQQRDFFSADLPANLDADEDGRLDSQADLDKDGLMDVVDNAIGAFGSYRDMDNDGIPNHLDEDDDNDGISDIEENNNSDVLTGKDADADGIDDGIDHNVNGTITGQDSNNNGIQDSLELPDTDGDGIADYLDNDGDNDGVTDNVDPSVSTETDVETGGALTVFSLMLLFALMIAVRQKKLLLILSALAFSMAGHSDELLKSNWDVSFTTGLSYLTPKLYNGLKLTDKTGWSMTAEVGYQFADDFRAKARYVDLGHAEINSAEVNYKAYVAAVEYLYDLNKKYQGYAAIGYGRLETSSEGGLNLDNSSEDHPYFNAGVRYQVIPTLSLVLDMNSYSPDAQEISFGFIGRF